MNKSCANRLSSSEIENRANASKIDDTHSVRDCNWFRIVFTLFLTEVRSDISSGTSGTRASVAAQKRGRWFRRLFSSAYLKIHKISSDVLSTLLSPILFRKYVFREEWYDESIAWISICLVDAISCRSQTLGLKLESCQIYYQGSIVPRIQSIFSRCPVSCHQLQLRVHTRRWSCRSRRRQQVESETDQTLCRA